jgi:hypothetical protein
MIIQNISKMLVVLADSSKHYATLQPGKKIFLPNDALEADCIAQPLSAGLLKVVDQGGKPEPLVKKGIPARAAKVEEFISRFGTREHEEDETDEGTVTATKREDSSDYTPPSRGKVEITDIGKKLVRGKSVKKKLVPMVKTSTESKQEVVKKGPRVIKMSGDGGDVALDTGSIDGSLIVNESGVPGQARVVSINDANSEDLKRAGELTNQILDSAAKDRKLAIYMSGDQSVRERFVENTKDVEFLKEVATIEWQGDIAKAVREKLNSLGAGNE